MQKKTSKMFALAAATLAVSFSLASAFASEEKHERPAGCEPGKCIIETRNPHAAPQPHSAKSDAPDVLTTVENVVKAYSTGDLKSYEAMLDDDCSYFDHERNKMIVGKANVIEHLKQSFAKHAPDGPQPLLAYTIDQPYIKVLGNTAVVTYRAFEHIGGKTPMDGEGLITKVFRRSDNGWKQQYDSSSWHAK